MKQMTNSEAICFLTDELAEEKARSQSYMSSILALVENAADDAAMHEREKRKARVKAASEMMAAANTANQSTSTH